MAHRKIDQLEIVLKTAERCNLNCSYCYFFHAGDTSYKEHPPLIPSQVVSDVAQFLRQGCADFEIKTVIVVFHGGEPLLQPLREFDKMCTTIREALSEVPRFLLNMQSNGTLISEAWIEQFEKHQVAVGVSCDGFKENNDRFRVDHRGRGSYDRMLKGFQRLQRSAAEGKSYDPSLLSVINPSFNGRDIYHHFTRELGAKIVDFKLPDFTHDSFKESPEPYGRFLCELLSAWTEDDDPDIKVRILESAFRVLVGKECTVTTAGPAIPNYELVTISSNGDLGPDDGLRSASPSFLATGKNVQNTTLREFLEAPSFSRFHEASGRLPKGCEPCIWKEICRGGNLLHRYSAKNQFDNPSVMCVALKQFYKAVVRYMLDHGIAQRDLLTVLKLDNQELLTV